MGDVSQNVKIKVTDDATNVGVYQFGEGGRRAFATVDNDGDRVVDCVANGITLRSLNTYGPLESGCQIEWARDSAKFKRILRGVRTEYDICIARAGEIIREVTRPITWLTNTSAYGLEERKQGDPVKYEAYDSFLGVVFWCAPPQDSDASTLWRLNPTKGIRLSSYLASSNTMYTLNYQNPDVLPGDFRALLNEECDELAKFLELDQSDQSEATPAAEKTKEESVGSPISGD